MSQRRDLLFAGLLFLAGPLLFPADSFMLGQSKDPFAGTWLLARGKSDFDPPYDAFFFRRTIMIVAMENGHKCIIRTISDRQQTFESTYEAELDGKDVPIENSQLETVALRRIDANTIERIGKLKGQVVETVTMKLSEGGKILTVVTKGTDADGPYSSTQIFTRQ